MILDFPFEQYFLEKIYISIVCTLKVGSTLELLRE
jgi:hypothetical protein